MILGYIIFGGFALIMIPLGIYAELEANKERNEINRRMNQIKRR